MNEVVEYHVETLDCLMELLPDGVASVPILNEYFNEHSPESNESKEGRIIIVSCVENFEQAIKQLLRFSVPQSWCEIKEQFFNSVPQSKCEEKEQLFCFLPLSPCGSGLLTLVLLSNYCINFLKRTCDFTVSHLSTSSSFEKGTKQQFILIYPSVTYHEYIHVKDMLNPRASFLGSYVLQTLLWHFTVKAITDGIANALSHEYIAPSGIKLDLPAIFSLSAFLGLASEAHAFYNELRYLEYRKLRYARLLRQSQSNIEKEVYKSLYKLLKQAGRVTKALSWLTSLKNLRKELITRLLSQWTRHLKKDGEDVLIPFTCGKLHQKIMDKIILIFDVDDAKESYAIIRPIVGILTNANNADIGRNTEEKEIDRFVSDIVRFRSMLFDQISCKVRINLEDLLKDFLVDDLSLPKLNVDILDPDAFRKLVDDLKKVVSVDFSIRSNALMPLSLIHI